MEKNSLSKKTILLVNTGSVKKKFILQRLKKLGLTIVMLHQEKNWAEPYVDHWIIADTYNHSEAILAFQKFRATHPKIKIDGALTFWEDDILLTSKIVDRFGFVGIPYAVAKQVRNKYVFREFCELHGIRAPRHRIIRNNNDLRSVAKNFTFPLVIKPAFGSSSAYVMRVNNKDELKETFNYIKRNISIDIESALTDGFDILIEEYIDGDEVDIDILLQNGKIKFYSISDNYNKNRGEFFVDSGQAIPSSLPEQAQLELITLAEESLEKLGIQDGCIHFEAKTTKTGPVPIEINMRMGGDYVYSYVKGAWNVDLIEQAARIATGDYIKIDRPTVPHKYIVGWDLHAESSGILVELNISEELEKKKYLEEIHIYKEIGDPILLPPEGYESLGWLTVSGDNLLDAQDNLKEALGLISYKVVEFDEESALGKTARKDRLSAAVFKKDRLLQAAKIERVRQIPVSDQRKLRIGIAGNLSHYNSHYSPGHRDLVQEIKYRLAALGYDITIFDLDNLAKVFYELRHSEVDLIMNVAEAIHNDDMLKPQAAALFETLHIPYTGTTSTNQALCRDKIRMKKFFTYHKLPTPKWDYAYTLTDTISSELRYPLIVKPGDTNNSVGITNGSVVTNKKQLEKQLQYIIEKMGRPALVEEYVEGEEYVASIIGNDDANLRVLPLTRVTFKHKNAKHWQIFTEHDRMRQNGSKKLMSYHSPVKNMSRKLESLITEIAIDAYKIMRCRDYAHIEIRVDKDDNPYVLEIDANPSLEKNLEIARAAHAAGMDYSKLLEEIIGAAIARYKKTAPLARLR